MHSDDGRRFLLREATHGQARSEVLDLLEAAGWSRLLLESWAAVGIVVELYDPADDGPCGAAIIDATGDGSFALRAWTVDTDGPEASARLVHAIADTLRRNGGRRVVAVVGDAHPQHLTVLLDAGFRVAGVKRDASWDEIGRPCDASRDLIWMDQDL
jgi:hypothetical protein